MATQGRFIPKNPAKYVGDASRIIFRSSWEIHVMKFLDSNPSVLKWASEEVKIPYIKPTDGQVHNYFPDFVVVFQDAKGEIQREIWEIKPLKESISEEAKTDRDKVALAINMSKWAAANEFARRHGMKFRIMTEKTLFHNVEKPKRTRKKK